MKTIILAGTGRGGTTIAADVLNASRRFHYLFEPLSSKGVPELSCFRPREFLDRESDKPEHVKGFRKILAGEFFNEWTQRHEPPKDPKGTLIKLVRANLLLGWMKHHFPSLQILLQVRHPLAVTDSRIRFNWPVTLATYTNQEKLVDNYLFPWMELLESCQTPFEQHVASWCIETLVPLLELEEEDYHPLVHERLVLQPSQTLTELGHYLGEEFGQREIEVLGKPSETASIDTEVVLEMGVDLTTKWRTRVSPEAMVRGFQIIRAFGLDGLYGELDELPDRSSLNEAREKAQDILRGKRGRKSMENAIRKERPTRILAYGPYAAWQLHGLWEMTLLHGLRVRGAQIHYFLCDGLYSDCDLHWQATAPRTNISCLQCQAKTTNLAASLGMDFTWLGRYLPPVKQEEAKEWAASIPDEELKICTYGKWEIGEWVRSSVHSHLRDAVLDLTNPEVVKAYRSYLVSGLTAAFAFDALLDDLKPDVMLALNGRFSSVRIGFELAKERGIRIVAHERGRTRESIILNHGPNGDLTPYYEMWEQWGEIPLNRKELDEITGFLGDRRKGKWQSFHSFSPPEGAVEKLRKQLGLSPDRPVWAVFPSSDDESVGSPERNLPFGDQDVWLQRTIAWAGKHPEIDLVVRAHPNIKGKFRGTNMRQYEMLLNMRASAPANVRMVMPEEELSTYDLMDVASVGLVFRSTAGLEMATMGKPVIIAAGGWYTGLPFVTSLDVVEQYEILLEKQLTQPKGYRAKEIQRGALRFAHAAFFKRNIPFPLVKMNDPHTGAPAYNNLADLAPGKEPGLDHACRIVLDAEAVVAPPTEADRTRSDADECEVLGDLDESVPTTENQPEVTELGSAPIREALELAERGLKRAAIARLDRLKNDPAFAQEAVKALELVEAQ